MKLRKFLFVVLCMSLVMAGCANSPVLAEIHSLEGMWRNPSGSHPTYTFMGDRVSFKDDRGNSWEGSFILTLTEITFIKETGTEAVWTQEFTFKGDALKLERMPGHHYGTFKKQ
jgi:hypothetical protein